MLFCSIEFVLFSILSATQKTKTKNSNLTKKLSEMRPSQIIFKKEKITIKNTHTHTHTHTHNIKSI